MIQFFYISSRLEYDAHELWNLMSKDILQNKLANFFYKNFGLAAILSLVLKNYHKFKTLSN